MPIIRLIYVKVEPDQLSEADTVWTEKCAPLMIQQPGCLSEQLLKCIDSPGEYIWKGISPHDPDNPKKSEQTGNKEQVIEKKK